MVAGWQAGAIYIAQGGWPLTPRVASDLLNQGARFSLYANSNGTDGNLPRSEQTPERGSTPLLSRYPLRSRSAIRDAVSSEPMAFTMWICRFRKISNR